MPEAALPIEDLTPVAASQPVPEEPLIWTTLGNVPIAALQHHIVWDNTPEYVKFTEIYKTAGGMVVKESSHVLPLTDPADLA